MTILNSQLFWWYLVNTGTVLANGYFRYKPNYIKPFPFPDQLSKSEIQYLENLADKIMALNGDKSNTDIKKIEGQINTFVYKLYNLTADDINWIEGLND